MEYAPSFIVGFARSGTTLLATMLDRHSQIAVTPETHFFDQYVATAPSGAKSKAMLVNRLLEQPRILDLGIGPDPILQAFEDFDCDARGLLCATLEAYRHKQGKQYVIEKTPAHLPYVPLIFDWFPNARVLYIERDGRDAVMSLMRMPWSHRNLRRHARMWRWCVGLAESFEKRFADRWMTVRYEALVRRPERELDRICGFLGVSREEAQLDPTIPTEVVPEWEREWKSNAANESVNTGPLQSWRSVTTNEQLLIMKTMMGRALRSRDYPDTRLPAIAPWKRVPNAVWNAVYLAAYHPRIRPILAHVKPLLTSADRDQPEAVGEDVCSAWHREHKTRDQIGA